MPDAILLLVVWTIQLHVRLLAVEPRGRSRCDEFLVLALLLALQERRRR